MHGWRMLTIILRRRQVLVGLLGIPERFDWRECTQSDDEERADAQAFKAAFTAFDPSL